MLFHLAKQFIDVGIGVIGERGAKDWLAQATGQLQRPQPIPRRFEQEEGINVSDFEQLGWPRRGGTAETTGLVIGPFLDGIADGLDVKRSRMLSRAGP